MVHRGKSITTVGIYVRHLRAIINIAKENGIIRPQDYRFGRRKYIIPGGRNMKKALNISQINKYLNTRHLLEPGWRKPGIFGYLVICATVSI